MGIIYAQNGVVAKNNRNQSNPFRFPSGQVSVSSTTLVIDADFFVDKIMNEVLKVNNEVTVFADGSAYISQRKTAELCGVTLKAIQKHLIKNGRHLSLSENNQLDSKSLVLVVTYYATKNRSKAIETLSMFAEAGAKAFLYYEAGYEFKAMYRDDIAAQLAEAQKRLAYCGIHENSTKATFELRDNAKVNAIKESWCELGYLTKRTVMKPVTEYGITPEGSEHLYYENKQVRIKPEAKHSLKLITHGFNIGRYGQSDLFIGQQAA